MSMIKGADELRAHLPDFRRVLWQYVALTLASACTGLGTMLAFDYLPVLLPGQPFLQVIAPITPLFGVSIVELLEFSIVHRMWTKRKALLATMKERAYQHGLRYICFGINLEYVVITRMFFPTPAFCEAGQFLATPLLSFLPGGGPVSTIIRVVAGLAIFGIGFALMFRATTTFGLDYLLYLYLYFPEKSEIQRNQIYSILRHPTYSSFILMCFGAAITWFSVYSFLFFLIVLFRWGYHVRFVEDKELAERFGESYRRYRKEVPAFLVHPRHLRHFFKFLRGRG